METPITALIGARASVFGGGKLDEIDAAMLHRRGDQKSETFEASEV